jgi:hypothetical protein
VTDIGASIGTALAGTVLIAALTTTFLGGVQVNPDVPRPSLRGSGGAGRSHPVRVRKDLHAALDTAGVPAKTAVPIVDGNIDVRINGCERHCRCSPPWC